MSINKIITSQLFSTLLVSGMASTLDNPSFYKFRFRNILLRFIIVSGIFALANSEALQETYDEWKLWKDRHPDCNPRTNEFQSPIKISSSKAKNGKDFEQLVVYTGLPVEECFAFSIEHNIGNFEMEAISILTTPGEFCEDDVPSISGVGEDRNRRMYFRRAFLFFTSSPVERDRSLHQIDENTFQMEIAMEFSDKNGNETTGVHLMVEALSPGEIPENPAFKVLELNLAKFKQDIAMKALDNGKTPSQADAYYEDLKNRCLDSEKTFNDSFTKQQEEMKNLTYDERIRQLQPLSSKLGGITKEKFQNRAAALKKAQDTANSLDDYLDGGTQSEIDKLRTRIEELNKKIREEETSQSGLDHSSYVDEIKRSKSRIEILERNGTAFGNSAFKTIRDAELIEAELEAMKATLRSSKIGVPGEAKVPGILFESPDALYEELNLVKNKNRALKRLKKEYLDVCAKLKKMRNKPRDEFYTTMTYPFQLSWLFPSSSGYYLYKGSNPLPPCERRDHTLVFEKPIRITTAQLEVFQSIPSLIALRKADPTSIDPNATEFDGKLRVDRMIPILHKSSELRQVWRVNRNVRFVGDDGFRQHTQPLRDSISNIIGGISGDQRIKPDKIICSFGVLIASLRFCKALTYGRI